MINYKLLPSFLNDFIHVPESTIERLKDAIGHDWVILPTKDHMSEEGFKYFSDLGIILGERVPIFKAVHHLNGPIHIDPIASLGINFVVGGSGKMEWLECNYEPTINEVQTLTGDYIKTIRFKGTDNKIIDTWESKTGDIALVRTHTPHRIVTDAEDRYCMSFRIKLSAELSSFDEVLQRFE